MNLASSSLSTRIFLRQCSAITGYSRALSTSTVRYAKDKKKDKGKEKNVVKKSVRKGEEETTKKQRLSPEAEMRIAVRKAKAASDRNPNKMTIEEAARVLRAVEVRSPWSAYDLLVKTVVMRGRPAPRGNLSLPRDPRTNQDVIVYFVEEDRVQEALDAGAEYAGGLDLVTKLLEGEIQPTKVFATPSLIPLITPKLGKFLGPQGLMPSAKKGTVSEDIQGTLKNFQGTIDWKADKSGTIRTAIARMNFPVQDVAANIKAFMNSVHENSRDPDDALYQKSKKTNSVSIISVSLSSRQGPGIELLHV